MKVKVHVPSTLRLIAWDTCFFKGRNNRPRASLVDNRVYQGLELQQPQPLLGCPTQVQMSMPSLQQIIFAFPVN